MSPTRLVEAAQFVCSSELPTAPQTLSSSAIADSRKTRRSESAADCSSAGRALSWTPVHSTTTPRVTAGGQSAPEKPQALRCEPVSLQTTRLYDTGALSVSTQEGDTHSWKTVFSVGAG